jgi:hypothetical protein
MRIGWLVNEIYFERAMYYEMVLIYQPPYLHVRISLRNAMAATKKINMVDRWAAFY